MNNVQLLGRLTKDFELSYQSKTGLAIAKSSLAINRINKDGADFINIVAFGKQAESLAQYTKKGDRLLINDGSINTGSYENKEGKKVYTTDIIINRFSFIEQSEKTQKSEK